MEVEAPGGKLFGVGINKNIVAASLEAIVSAANRLLAIAGQYRRVRSGLPPAFSRR